jgi:predicted acetyltransferase
MATLTTPRIEIRAANSGDELHCVHELMAKAHRPEFSSSMQWFESTGATYPAFRPEHTRVALINGEIAGALRVTTEVIRLGEARLKMGGLGWVSTVAEHRHKGVSTALVRATLHYMSARGYHVSMLFGIPNFYHRFGYTTTLADYFVTLDAKEAARASTQYVLARPIKPGDLPVMQRIHAANDADVACSLLRSTAHLTNKWHKIKGAEVLTNTQGRVLAYVLGAPDGDAFLVTEAGIESPASAPALIAHCARRAQDALLPMVRFAVPPNHAVGRALRQYESTHETRLCRERGGMMTLLDAAEAIENLLPEWEARVAESALAGVRTEVTLLVDGAPYRVRATRGALDVAPGIGSNKFSVSGQELIQLLTGYTHVAEVLHARRRLITADGQALLEALFPKRDPYVHLLDRF